MVKGKCKSCERMQQAVDELEYLVTFNRSISQAMARTMQDSSEGVFISVANFILAHRYSYLEYLHMGVKHTTHSLCTAPVHLQSLFPDQLLIKAEEEVPEVKRGVCLASHTGNPVVSIYMLPMTNFLINRTGSRLSQLGSKYMNANRERKVMASPQLSHRNRPRVPNLVNDNYCVKCVTGLKDCVCVPGQRGLNPSPVTAKDRDLINKSETINLLVNSCVANAHSVVGLPQKKGVNPNYYHNYTNKICERCFLWRSLQLCKSCHKCPNCCHRSTCRGKSTLVLGKMGNPMGESKGSN